MHISVLLKETIEGLDLKKGDIVLDGTLGLGGHSKEICKSIGSRGHLIGLDEDSNAISQAKENLDECESKVSLKKSNFRNFNKVLKNLNIEKVDKMILDLGFSSLQIGSSKRGFSFLKDETLLMTLNDKPEVNDLTATEILNNWDEENIADIIYGYGEEKFSRKIAKAIVKERKEKDITTTFQLVKIIQKSVPSWYRHKKIHYATKTFQALRIAVNDELGALKEFLDKSFKYLSVGGRIAVISFHSLEDREVKIFFKDKTKEELAKLVVKKIIRPSKEEIQINPRSRSAKLRIIEKIKNE